MLKTTTIIAIISLTACTAIEPEAVVLDIAGQVQDDYAKTPIADAQVVFYSDIGGYLGEATSNGSGDYSTILTVPYGDAGIAMHSFISREGFVEVEAHDSFFLFDPSAAALALAPAHTVTPSTVNMPTVGMVPNSAELGSIGGRIFDALNINQITGIGGLEVVLREGLNAPSDNPEVARTTTSGSGAVDSFITGYFQFDDIPPGTYTAFIEATEEYHDAFFTVYSHGGILNPDQHGATSTPPGANAARIILFWDDAPSNLDLHLTGPIPGQGLEAEVIGTERLHVYSGQAIYPAESSAETADVVMNMSGSEGLGPETVTINSLEETDVYRLSVHDGSNRESPESSAMSFSRAKVEVIIGDSIRKFYEIKVDEPATLWKLLEFNGGTMETYPLNSYGFETDPSATDSF